MDYYLTYFMQISYQFRLKTCYVSRDLCGKHVQINHTHELTQNQTKLLLVDPSQSIRNVLHNATAMAWMTSESISIGGGDFSLWHCIQTGSGVYPTHHLK